MATINLGRIKPVFRGAYSGATAYVVDDIVTHGDESFICIQAHGAGTQATSVTAYWTKLAAKGTDGTDVGTTITAQGDILYRDGSGLQKLAKPASDKFLQNTSGGVLTWETVASGKETFLSSTTITSDTATFDGDQLLPSTYNNFVIDFFNICPTDSSDQDMIIYMRSGGAGSESTFTGNVQYGRMASHGSGGFLTDQQDSTGGHMRFHRSGCEGNGDNMGGYYRCELFNVHNKAPSTTTSVGYLHFRTSSLGQVASSTHAYGGNVWGLIKTEGDYTGFHLTFGTQIRGANRPMINVYGVNNVN